MITQDSQPKRVARKARRLIKPLTLAIFVAVILLVGSLATWYYHAQNNADRVFWGMVQNNLSTSSVSRVVTQDDGQQTLKQVVQIQTSPTQLVNSQSVITQGDDASTKVTTESIGTPTTDYVRYTEIKTTQKSATGKDLDFSKIQNIWGKTEPQKDESGKVSTSGQLYNELVLSMIPFSNLTAEQSNKLIQQMKSKGVYTFHQTKVERKFVLGRPTFTFAAEINPQQYISVLKTLATDLGLTQLKGLDPAQYQSAQPVSVELKVDGWSHQLIQMTYAGSGRVENFSAYNSKKTLNTPPTNVISVNELQTRLQSIQ